MNAYLLTGDDRFLDPWRRQIDKINAQIQAERDRYVAAYELFEVMGNVETALEGAPIGRYDAEANAKRVRGKGWQEFGYDPDPRTDRSRNQAPPLVGPTQ